MYIVIILKGMGVVDHNLASIFMFLFSFFAQNSRALLSAVSS